MKPLLLCLFQLTFIITIGQPDSAYQAFIARAGLFHLQKKYKDAITCYQKAFQLQQPDALNAYKAAGAFSLDSNADEAFHYLTVSFRSGWTEADWLSIDPYFDYLRKSKPGKWKETERQAFRLEKAYEHTLKLAALRKKINLMTLNDQRLRYKKIQASHKNEIDSIDQLIMVSDLKNLNSARTILRKYGWPKISDIGKDGQNNLWLVVQHADADVLFQQKALHLMEKLSGTPGIDPENYAFLYDRVQVNLNYKQRFGTQVSWTNDGEASGFRSIIKEDLVDERRIQLGLVPLKFYALTYGFTYKNVSHRQAAVNDSSTLAQTRELIDSARLFYNLKEYQKVYDCYNNASVFPGGMTNKDNYDAAVIFSEIAVVAKEQQYKDIALDFLNLLYLRKKLNKAILQSQLKFKILHQEKRWVDMQKNVQD